MPACQPASQPYLLSPATHLLPPLPAAPPTDVVVVTATRDGMNLVPYEYVVCRQGPSGSSAPGGSSNGGGGSNMLPDKRHGMLVVSEFVGCSPSLSGAIRVNPWSIEAVGGVGRSYGRGVCVWWWGAG